jgi:hypothetical protein
MPHNETIDLPHGLLGGYTMKENTDSISFKVKATCTFSYSDPTPCFPSFLPAATYTATNPPTIYGPYTPNQAGTVECRATTGIEDTDFTASSITVDS